MEKGRAQDPLMCAVMREVWWLAAVRDVDIIVRHLPGTSMGVADAVSREEFDPGARKSVRAFVREARKSEVRVDLSICDQQWL